MLEFPQLNEAINRILSVSTTAGDANQTSFSETDLLRLSQLLRDAGKIKWAERPRTYAILHLIGQQEAIENFVAEDIVDISLPFERESRLPFALKAPTARKAFIELQGRVLTAAADVEKKQGTHQSLINGDYYYKTRADLGSGSFGWVDHVWSTLSLESFARKRIRRRSSFRQDQEAITTFINELKILQRCRITILLSL
jgi:serine/threonine protein kinase